MPSPLLLPVVTCAAVLLVSGVAKLQSPASVEAAFTSMRVPASLDTPLVRRVLPWLEVALGVWLLLATGTALAVVAVLTLLLFLAYLALVVVAVRGPEPADCGCFGSIGDSRVTRVTVWRNALLVVAAVLAVAGGLRGVGLLPAVLEEPSTWGWLAAAALSAAVAVLVAHRSGRAVEPDEPQVDASGDYVRTPVPLAAVQTVDGDLVLLKAATRGAAHLLVFVSPHCGSCARVIELVPEWAEELEPVAVTAVLAANPALLDEHFPHLRGHAWFDPWGVTRAEFGKGYPGAVLIGADGYLAGGPVEGEDAVRELVSDIGERLREAREAGELPVPGAGQEGPADDQPLAVSAHHEPAASVTDVR